MDRFKAGEKISTKLLNMSLDEIESQADKESSIHREFSRSILNRSKGSQSQSKLKSVTRMPSVYNELTEEVHRIYERLE